MKRKIIGNGEENKPTREKLESGPPMRVVTRLQAKLRGLATPKKQPPAASSTNSFEDPSPLSACFVSSSSSESNCQGTTSLTTDQSLSSFKLNDDTWSGGSSAKTPPQVRALLDALYESESESSHESAFPRPSSSPIKAPEFGISDSSFRPASRGVQVAEPRGVGRTETAAPQLWREQLWRATNYRKNFLEAHNPKAPSSVSIKQQPLLSTNETAATSDIAAADRTKEGPWRTSVNVSHKTHTSAVGNLSASATDKPIAMTNVAAGGQCPTTPAAATDGFRPTSVAEKTKEFIGNRPGLCSDDPDQHDVPGCSCSLSFTDLVNMMNEQDFSEDDVESGALVTFENYQVKPSSKPILDLIFHKYGDIAANLEWELPVNRSAVLDELCQIIQAFQGKNLTNVPESELRREVDRLRVWKRLGLEILWLLERLEGVLEARQLLHRSTALKDEKDTKAEAFKSKKSEVEELAQKKIFFREEIQKMMLDEQAVAQKMISSKQELKATEAELQKTNEKISEAKRKISPYAGCPILDKLL